MASSAAWARRCSTSSGAIRAEDGYKGGSGNLHHIRGGEGTGKSSQARRLAAALEASGREVVLTREPGGSPGAEDIRKLLVTGDPGRWDGMTEALLNFAARRDHLRVTILPALERGAWVVSDRFADSTMAYQGYAHGIGVEAVNDLYRIAVGDFRPDLTVILDLPEDIGLGRAKARGDGEDRYERMEDAFHGRLRAGFRAIAASEPERCALIEVVEGLDATFARVKAAVEARLGVTLP